mmetsp:Transcript_6081/g.14109  ORF Transcript_6081/g.14109 Transcript_6081/m.14109 type:complete len:210 (-) Transcript_6081:378-1007(-)
MVISRRTKSLPALLVKAWEGRKATTTPHKSATQGRDFSPKVFKSRRPSRRLPVVFESAVKVAVLPSALHHFRRRSASGILGSMSIAPASMREPLMLPFHSLRVTPFKATIGCPSKAASACEARSPQMATTREVQVSSASTNSRFTRDLPSLEVKAVAGLWETMTAQRSTVQGMFFWPTACKSTKEYFTVSIEALSAVSSIRASRSKTSS